MSFSGQGMPIRIHWLIASIWASGSLSAFSGILESPMCLSDLMNSLSSGLPGTMTGPSSVPFKMAARESTRSEPFCFSGPWHL